MKKTRVQIIIGAFILSLLIAGCNDAGEHSKGDNADPYKIVKVSYKLNGSEPVSCPDAYDISTLKAQKSDDIGIQKCTWLCGSYQGESPVTVILQFEQDGKDSSWEFSNDFIKTAPNNCHK